MKLHWAILLAAAAVAVLFALVYFAPGHFPAERRGWRSAVEWQRMASPGRLSQGHAFLEHNCRACHTPVKGAEAVNCILCHANNQALLARQPTAFHADIGSCRECHHEHLGRDRPAAVMDHEALTRIASQRLEQTSAAAPARGQAGSQLNTWLKHGLPVSGVLTNPHLSPRERLLDCAACHKNQDRHFGLFGSDCSACHGTATWAIREYRHPPPSSLDCAQCHQAPPSHYMGHFEMVSMKVAGVEHADVRQCFLCHQTTSWNDIKGFGFYKHH